MLRGPFSGSNPNQPLRLSVLWHKKAAEAFLRVNFHLNDREPNHLLHCATTATLVAEQDSIWGLLRYKIGELANSCPFSFGDCLCIELGEH